MTTNNVKTQTQQIIYEMMTENTGKHFLDSGMMYGYQYDRNVTIDQKPTAWIEYGSVTINTYHHLCNNLSFNADVQANFDAFVAENDPDNKTSWEDLLQAWIKANSHEVRNDGYTYNYDNALSSDFVWYEIELCDGDDMVIIRTHNGCDARGGFSAPKFFDYRYGNDIYDTNLLNVLDVYVYCPSDTCEFSADNSYGDYRWRNRDDEMVEIAEDENGNLLCPICASILKADKY